MTIGEVLRLSYAEFLARIDDPNTPERIEFWDGFVVQMGGGTVRHSYLGSQVLVALRAALQNKPCLVFGSDLRIRVESLNAGFFPDVSVICGPIQTASDDKDGVVNPTLIVEVISPSSDTYDRGAKFIAYSKLDSLKAYLLVDSTTGSVELLEKQHVNKWNRQTILPNERSVLHIESLKIELTLVQLFEKFDDLPK
jgi:Uma2 family endonuclease